MLTPGVLTQEVSLGGTDEPGKGRSADFTMKTLLYDLSKIFLPNRSVNHLVLSMGRVGL